MQKRRGKERKGKGKKEGALTTATRIPSWQPCTSQLLDHSQLQQPPVKINAQRERERERERERLGVVGEIRDRHCTLEPLGSPPPPLFSSFLPPSEPPLSPCERRSSPTLSFLSFLSPLLRLSSHRQRRREKREKRERRERRERREWRALQLLHPRLMEMALGTIRSCLTFGEGQGTRGREEIGTQTFTQHTTHNTKLSRPERTNEQTNKQTNKQTNEQTNEQTNKYTNKQTNEQTNEQTNKRTNKRTNEQTRVTTVTSISSDRNDAGRDREREREEGEREKRERRQSEDR